MAPVLLACAFARLQISSFICKGSKDFQKVCLSLWPSVVSNLDFRQIQMLPVKRYRWSCWGLPAWPRLEPLLKICSSMLVSGELNTSAVLLHLHSEVKLGSRAGVHLTAGTEGRVLNVPFPCK